MSQFSIELINYFDRDYLIAEIYYDNFLWVEISQKTDSFEANFHPHPHQEHWEFPFEEAIHNLEQAKSRLMKKSSMENLFRKTPKIDPKQMNEQAQKILEGIVTHPAKQLFPGEFNRYGKVVDIYAPDLGGVRYSANGEFIGFLEP